MVSNSGTTDQAGAGRDLRPPAIFLLGPTASGKTELAVRLIESLPCEIVSVDSAQVYRGMDIGSAKPGPELLARAPHRLIDICDPAEPYSAARFREDALREMAGITAVGRIPLLVGGTMLYFRALQCGLSELPAADHALRERLLQEGRTKGWQAMHARLAERDPLAAARIHPNDPQRIQRALEVIELTGRPLSELHGAAETPEFPYRLVKIARAPRDRSALHRRIERRFHQMLEDGLEEEVRRLLQRGDLTPDLPSLRSVGYRQMVNYLLKNSSREEMIERGIIATRQLAKRQYTWLRSERALHWLDDGAAPAARELIERDLGLEG